MKNELFSKLKKLKVSGESPVKFNLLDMSFGDNYHYEESEVFEFKIGDSFYKVGYCKVVEDEDDWAQAESYFYNIFMKNDIQVKMQVIDEDLNNYLQIERESKLNKIL